MSPLDSTASTLEAYTMLSILSLGLVLLFAFADERYKSVWNFWLVLSTLALVGSVGGAVIYVIAPQNITELPPGAVDVVKAFWCMAVVVWTAALIQVVKNQLRPTVTSNS